MDIEGLSKTNIRDLGVEIGKAGFVASDFESIRIPHRFAGASDEPSIGHRPSRSWFAFGRHLKTYAYDTEVEDIGFHVGYHPAEHSDFNSEGPLDWPGVLSAFRKWLGHIRRSSEAMSFEDAVKAGASLIDAHADAEADTAFTDQERQRIASDLARIESLLRASTTQREAAESFIKSELAGVREELARMKRDRWRSLFTGALVRMSAEKLVTSDKAREIYAVAKEYALRHIPNQLLP